MAPRLLASSCHHPRIALLAALAAWVCAGAAPAVTLSISADKASYSVGETITITVTAATTPAEETDAIYGRLLYSGAVTTTVNASQNPLTTSASPWTTGPLQTGDGFADAFNQSSPSFTPDPADAASLVRFAKVWLVADAPGDVVVTWATSLDFFGLTNAPATSFTIGGTPIPPFIAVPNIPHPSISGPSIAGVGDIDLDGDDDLIAKGVSNRTVAWYEYDRFGGTWTEHVVATTTGSTNLFTVNADIDGDGDQDMIVNDQGSATLAWYENENAGTTWTPHTIGSGAAPIVVSTGDVDGDGDIDVLNADAGLGQYRWFSNDAGDGSSWTAHTIASSVPAAAVILDGDIDGDGDLDAATSNPGASSTIQWHENVSGDGSTWAAHTVTTSAPGVVAPVPWDVDGDGDEDVLAASNASVDWYENNGNGTSWTPRNVGATSGQSIALPQDADQDGDLDIWLASAGNAQLSWFENTDGLATAWNEHVLATDAPNAIAIAGFDFDRDGDLDPVAEVTGDDTIRFFRNETIHRSAAPRPAAVIDPLRSARAIVSGDVDGDGDIDLVSMSSPGGGLVFHENTAGDASSWSSTTISSIGAQRDGIKLADVDGDGDLDLFADNTGIMEWHENTNGDGSAWANHGMFSTDIGHLDAADVDGDGDVDLLFTDPNTNPPTEVLAARLNTSGDGSTWNGTPTIASGVTSGIRELLAADIDGDGDVDAVASSTGDQQLRWYKNTNGAGSFSSQPVIHTSPGLVLNTIPVDLDRDGDIDLATSGYTDGTATVPVSRWYENTAGDGSSWSAHSVASIAWPSGMAADFDADGDIDIVGPNGWIENTDGVGGSWVLRSPIDASIGAAGSTAGPWEAVADLDRDGDLDAVLTDLATNRIVWFENRGGQLALATTGTAPASLGTSPDDVLKIVATHRGRFGDHPVELVNFQLRFADGAGTPLTTTQLDDAIASLRVYRDNGSGTFGAGDTQVVSSPFTPLGPLGVANLPFDDGDANMRVEEGEPQTYFVVLEREATPGAQAPAQMQVTHLTSSSSTAEDAFFDTPAALEFAPDTGSGVFAITGGADTDGDGLPDSVETNTGVYVSPTNTGSNPLVADTDGDGLLDGAEVSTHGTNPNLADTDGDGLNDSAEIALGTDPTEPDTDSDQVNDGTDNCPLAGNTNQNNTDPFPAGDACQCGDLDADGDLDASDVAIARANLVGRTIGVPFDITRCNVVGASDGGVNDCNLADIFILRRIELGLPVTPGNVCDAYLNP